MAQSGAKNGIEFYFKYFGGGRAAAADEDSGGAGEGQGAGGRGEDSLPTPF